MSTADERRIKQTLFFNIAKLRERAEASEEQRRIYIRMAVKELAAETKRAEELYETFAEEIYRADAADKALLCRILLEEAELSDSAEALLGKRFLGTESADADAVGRIAYVRNRRSDGMFLNISRGVKGARAHYRSSFSEACEAVNDGKCEYCLLPVENNTDGKLYSFYALLDRYELKIRETVTSGNEDGGETVTFALAGKSLAAREGSCQRLEFSVIRDSGALLRDIITAADTLGGSVTTVGTQPVAYDEGRKRFFFSVDFPENVSPLPMALYVALEYPKATPLGLYATEKET